MQGHFIKPTSETTQQARNQTWSSVLRIHPAADLLPRPTAAGDGRKKQGVA
jgi:hypothetical protein